MAQNPQGDSEFVRIRGLRYHVRRWPGTGPKLLVLHGWLDVSATWSPVVAALGDGFDVLAPDWRGFGYSQWPEDGYWFPDYVADLEALLAHYAPEGPVMLVGHSMGGQIASLYAGLRPERVRRLVLVDSLFLPDMAPELAPQRFLGWLEELSKPAADPSYPSFAALAERILRRHPRLTPERAEFIARCWGWEDGRGRIRLCADPKHRLRGPGLYRVEESMAIWRRIAAPTLFIDAGASPFGTALPAEETTRRRRCFRDHQVARIEGAGHMLHFEAPEALAGAIGPFLREAPCN